MNEPAYEPRHRRDVDNMPALLELDQLRRDHEISVSRSGPDQHVYTVHRRTAEHDGQVLMVVSPKAANVLAQIITRFTSMYSGQGLVGLEDYDPSMWQHAAIDILRHKAHAGHLPASVRRPRLITEPVHVGPPAPGRHLREVNA